MCIALSSGADLAGGVQGIRTPPFLYEENDVMHTVIYAAFRPWICKLANRSSQAGSISI